MKKLFVEVADNSITRSYGLMDRKSLAKNQGMIFPFPYIHRLSFWMKNTYIPLDIAFLDESGKITQIESMMPLSTRMTQSIIPCKYALEVNQGWFKQNGLKVGSYVAGEGLTHRKGKGKLTTSQNWNSFGGEVEMGDQTPGPMGPMGEFGLQAPPDRLYTEPYGEGQEPEHTLNVRDTIKQAEVGGLSMEIMYWTMGGHVLPPRRIMPLPDEGYPIKSGPNGEFLVAFDTSPTIQGSGWVLKGGQPKSFILDNIISLQIVGEEEIQQIEKDNIYDV